MIEGKLCALGDQKRHMLAIVYSKACNVNYGLPPMALTKVKAGVQTFAHTLSSLLFFFLSHYL